MRTMTVCAVLLVSQVAVVHAQPGAPPGETQLVLSAEDAELLESGEISDGEHIGGGIAAITIGLGVGQAIQGRWHETGWIFTVGELATITIATIGIGETFHDCPIFGDQSRCGSSNGPGLFLGGMFGYAAVHIWGIVDAFAAPPAHNRRLHELRRRLGVPDPQPAYALTPYLLPTSDRGGGVAGIALSF